MPHTSADGGGGGSVVFTAGGASGRGVLLTQPTPACTAIGWLHGTHCPTHTKLGPGDGLVGAPHWAAATEGTRTATARTSRPMTVIRIRLSTPLTTAGEGRW